VWGTQHDLQSVDLMNRILDLQSPQLVVLNGDQITGDDRQKPDDADGLVEQIVGPMVHRQIPWASTYGNHNNNYNSDTHAMMIRELQLGGPLALTKSMVAGPQSGVSNFNVPVHASFDPNGGEAPVMLLWFFDSRGGNHYQQSDENGHPGKSRPNWVDQSVVDWFTQESMALEKRWNATISSLAFVHIPPYATAAFAWSGRLNPVTEPGINRDGVDPQASGWNTDGSPSKPWNSGMYGHEDEAFMRALVNTPGLMTVFSGHNHRNDWCWKWNGQVPGLEIVGDGVNFCFGRHSGYGGYGRDDTKEGSRQILIRESMLKDRSIETWMAFPDNTVSGNIVLNETYGKVSYPGVVA